MQVTDGDKVPISEEDQWWKDLEESVGVAVPTFLKNILNFMGFNNRLTLSNFDSTVHVRQIEDFARDVMPDLLDPSADATLYYGPFSKRRDKFFIMAGHKLLLENLAEHCRKEAFLKPKSRPCKSLSVKSSGCSNVKNALKGSNSDAGTVEGSEKHSKFTHASVDLECLTEKARKCVTSMVAGAKNLVHDKDVLLHSDVNVFLNDGKVEAKITCAVCLESKNVGSSVCTIDFSQGRWLNGNFKRHLERFHTKDKDEKSKGSSGNAKTSKGSLSVIEMMQKGVPVSSSSVSSMGSSSSNSQGGSCLQTTQSEDIVVEVDPLHVTPCPEDCGGTQNSTNPSSVSEAVNLLESDFSDDEAPCRKKKKTVSVLEESDTGEEDDKVDGANF